MSSTDVMINSILCAYYDEIYRLLEKYGYREHVDFIYIRHQPVVVNSTCDYSDKYNNVLEGRLPEGGRIIFSGYNAHVVIGKNIKFNGTIEVRNNSRFIIGDNVTIENANWWRMKQCVKSAQTVNLRKQVWLMCLTMLNFI